MLTCSVKGTSSRRMNSSVWGSEPPNQSLKRAGVNVGKSLNQKSRTFEVIRRLLAMGGGKNEEMG